MVCVEKKGIERAIFNVARPNPYSHGLGNAGSGTGVTDGVCVGTGVAVGAKIGFDGDVSTGAGFSGGRVSVGLVGIVPEPESGSVPSPGCL